MRGSRHTCKLYKFSVWVHPGVLLVLTNCPCAFPPPPPPLPPPPLPPPPRSPPPLFPPPNKAATRLDLPTFDLPKKATSVCLLL